MSYSIETRSVSEFVNDVQLKLPRFQRRSTWKEYQNFELAISIFQDYPVGVVIVNKESDSSWLLDGRQRRSALREMRANPVSVYNWAKKYMALKGSDDEEEIRNKFWGKVEEYLQKDKSNSATTTEIESSEESEAISFDADRQRKGLNTLLDIILMVRKVTINGSTWERNFDFGEYFTKIKYAPTRFNKKIQPELLREFILEMLEKQGEITKELFINHYEDNFDFVDADKSRLKFEADVDKRWDSISKSFDIIKRSERIFKEARIGVIVLTHVQPLDAQNIFSRINSGGTQLKAEELLSAKPFWNIEVTNSTDPKLKDCVQKLYERLDVEVPQNIVRWDLGASLLNRINDRNLLFDPYVESEDKGELNMDQVSLGFKLISSIYLGGMSSKVVNDLEKCTNIDWNTDIDDLVYDVNRLCELLLTDNFFKCLLAWKKSIAKLMGNAIVLEFITIIYKDWKENGSPIASGAQNILRHAKILFDRLVFEYAAGGWRGSGDSKMANHIANWKERLEPIDSQSWEILLKGACAGFYNGQSTNLKNITPIVYYANVLRGMLPINEIGVSFDIDHTIPQDRLFDNPMVTNKRFVDSLSNLALLPKKENISKSNKALNEVTDEWLKKQITIYLGIEEAEFTKFSDITSIDTLIRKRESDYLSLFGNNRISQLSK